MDQVAPTKDSSLDGIGVPAPTPAADRIPSLIGPVPTYDHRLLFKGISTTGSISLFEQHLENYLKAFYSPTGVTKLPPRDPLRSLSDVSIELTIINVEKRRLGRAGPSSGTGGTRRRRRSLQTSAAPQLTLVYNQGTEYRTSNPSVSIDAIVSRPFSPEFVPDLVAYLQRRDRTFADLWDVAFVDEEQTPSPTQKPTRKPTREPTRKPTMDPTMAVAQTTSPTTWESMIPPSLRPVETDGSNLFVEDEATTPPPTSRRPSRRPSPAPTKPAVVESPSRFTIQGLLWLDTDADGLFDAADETLLDDVYVNLRKCEGDKWEQTVTTNARGKYQFFSDEPGEYYVEFFMPDPNNPDQYAFTRPKVAFGDDDIIDSDVVLLEETMGKSECMEMAGGFGRTINAGYRLKATVAPTQTPTAAPTVPRFCAEIKEDDEGKETWNFWGCRLPCESPHRHNDCPEGMRCALTHDCS